MLTGLTKISKITSSKIENGEKVPCDGQLWYRGYRVEDLIGNLGDEELGFEKIAYLLLMGEISQLCGKLQNAAHKFYQRCDHEGTDGSQGAGYGSDPAYGAWRRKRSSTARD